MQIDIVNLNHEKTGTVDLPEDVFGTEVKTALLWEQVKAQRASKRRGTHDTKTRANVRGGGASPLSKRVLVAHVRVQPALLTKQAAVLFSDHTHVTTLTVCLALHVVRLCVQR